MSAANLAVLDCRLKLDCVSQKTQHERFWVTWTHTELSLA